MWKLVLLILPALIPSWRFFKVIEPSPRLQWATLDAVGEVQGPWREARVRPRSVSCFQMVVRLFWNPVWNETLYLMSCAERVVQSPTEHCIKEIRHRITPEVAAAQTGAASFCFRLALVQNADMGQRYDVVFTSVAFSIPTTPER